MEYQLVHYRVWTIPQLEPISTSIFVLAFLASVFLTRWRPAYGAALLLAVAPFDFAHAVLGTTIGFPKVALLGVVIGLLMRRGSLRRVNWRPAASLLMAFGLIIIAIALSELGASHTDAVLRELAKWCEYLAIFGTAYACIIVDSDLVPASWAILASGLVVCATALSEEFLGAQSGFWFGSTPIPRIAGVLEGPNQLGGYLEVAITTLAALQIASPSRVRAASLALASLTLFLTFSRAAYVAVLIALLVLAWTHRARVMGTLLAIAAGTVAGIASTAALFGILHVRDGGAFAQTVTRSGSENAGGVGNRSELWRAATFFFTHHPIFGIGAGNFELRLPEAGLHGVRTHANSWYLQSLAEGGIALFSATLFFIYSSLATLRRSLRRSPWALAGFAATVALALHQVVDYLVFYPKVAEPWIVLVALGVAAPPGESCDS